MEYVWMFFPTGDLFPVEEMEDKFKVSYGEHLKELFNLDHNAFMRLSICLSEL